MSLDRMLRETGLDFDKPFAAPWEARSFSMAIRLSESGVFTWDEFRERLIAEIAVADRAPAHGWQETGPGYYTHFLRALEAILREKGILDEAALAEKMAAIGAGADHDHEH